MDSLAELPELWQAHWENIEYGPMTKIQKESFLPLTRGEDVLGISPTGTGKTVAYLLPLLLKIKKNEGMQLLILLPSQELAVQVANVCREWASIIDIRTATVVGGGNVKRQVESLKKKPEVLIGTPGRVNELITSKKIKAHQIKTLVLDEIDSLIPEGQTTMVHSIIKSLSRTIQIVGYSATGEKTEQQFQELSSRTPVSILVEPNDEIKGCVFNTYIEVVRRKRVDMLRRLSHTKNFKAIIFFNQVSDLGAVSQKLAYEHIPHSSLASDQHKSERQQALDSFRNGKTPLLLTTDIGSRGLDIDDLYYVVNYECPLTTESYVHRSGRVGRMGRDGMIMTLCSHSELPYLKKIIQTNDVEERFIYGGDIVADKPEVESKKEDTTSQKSTDIIRSKQKNTSVKKEIPENNIPNDKKKKHRLRDRKNKGMRRKDK